MKFLGHRLSFVGSAPESLALAKTLASLGISPRDIYAKDMQGTKTLADEDFSGAVFAADEINWIEIWAELPNLPKGFMLQLIVDDADEFAEHARKNGLAPQGPVEAHGEKIYYIMTPIGLPISFQSITGEEIDHG